MILSKAAQYALRAVIYLAHIDSDGFIPVKEVAQATDISYFFLGKIMNTLLRKGLIESYKGPNGGVKLIQPIDEITLLDIVKAIEGEDFLKDCFIGLPECNENNECVVHHDWNKIRNQIYSMLSHKSIDKVAVDLEK